MAEGLTDIIEDDGDDVGILLSAQDDGDLQCCQSDTDSDKEEQDNEEDGGRLDKYGRWKTF